MQIDRLFAEAPLLRDGPGVLDRRGADDSDLRASALVGQAQERSFAGLEQAEARRTAAMVGQGEGEIALGQGITQIGGQFGRIAASIKIKEDEQRRTVEFHSRTAQYALDTDEALRLASAESSPDGRDLGDRFGERQRANREKLLAGVDDPVLRDSLQVRAYDRDATATIDARRLASGKLKQWAIDEFDKSDAARLKRLAEGRLDETTVAQAIVEQQANVDDMVRSGVLTAAQGEAARTRFRATAGKRIANAAMATNPEGYLKDLQAGRYNGLFDQDEVATQSGKAFERVLRLKEHAAAMATRAELAADRVLKKQGEDVAKDAYDLIDKGQDVGDFLSANKARLSKADYSALLKANRREERITSDPETIIDLTTRLASEDVSVDASRAYREGRLSKEDYLSTVGKTRAALRDDQPASPYKSARELVRSTLDPTNLITGPGAQIAKVGMANALVEVDDWAAKNPTATRADAMAFAREVTQRYAILNYDQMSLAAEPPRSIRGSRNDIDAGALDRAEQTAVQQFDSGQLTRAEYQDELGRIQNWRGIVQQKAAAAAPATGRGGAQPARPLSATPGKK